jgi:hypothetical protein
MVKRIMIDNNAWVESPDNLFVAMNVVGRQVVEAHPDSEDRIKLDLCHLVLRGFYEKHKDNIEMEKDIKIEDGILKIEKHHYKTALYIFTPRQLQDFVDDIKNILKSKPINL